MNSRLNPALFARVLQLDEQLRVDLLEKIGDTPIEEVDLDRLLNDIEMKQRMKKVRGERLPS